MTLIDGDRIVTTHLYDEEYEACQEEKMSIIDFVNTYSDEGVTTADDVLDKIREEIEFIPTIEWKDNSTTYILASYFKKQVLEIINKYIK